MALSTGSAGQARSATRHQLDTMLRLGVPVLSMSALPSVPRGELVLDRILGYGLEGPARGTSAQLMRWISSSNERVLSLDTPSGLDVDTGLALGEAIRADATLTLAAAKPGLLAPHSGQHVGALYVADIGVPRELIQRVTGRPGPTFGPDDLLAVAARGPDGVTGLGLSG